MPETKVLSVQATKTGPDYTELVKFLLQPLLDSPEFLSVDTENLLNHRKVWIRVAFKGEDKGRVFGRGGRNIQAIRTILESAAKAAGQSLYLDIYGSQNTSLADDTTALKPKRIRRSSSRRPTTSKPSFKRKRQERGNW